MTSYSNHMVAHLWANQLQPEASNRGNTFWFRGRLLDTRYTRADGVGYITDYRINNKQIVLITTEPNGGRGFSPHYSNIAYHALDADRYHRVYAPRVNMSDGDIHPYNIAHFEKQYQDRAVKEIKPYASYGTEEARLARIWEGASPLIDYCTAFGLDVPVLHDYTEELLAAFVGYNSPKAVAKRERASLRREQISARQISEAIAYVDGIWPHKPDRKLLGKLSSWRSPVNNEDYRIRFRDLLWPSSPRASITITPEQWQAGQKGNVLSVNYALVRKRGETLQTSEGAEVPFEDAVRVFQIAQAGRWNGDNRGHRVHVGHFMLDKVFPNGDIKVGCHLIPYHEMVRLAIKEGVPVRARYPLPVPITSCPLPRQGRAEA